MNLGLFVALENADKSVSNIQRIFNTGPYGDPPLKIKISKIGLRHVLSWPKLVKHNGLVDSQEWEVTHLTLPGDVVTQTDTHTRK